MVGTRALLANIASSRHQCIRGRALVLGAADRRPKAVVSWLPQYHDMGLINGCLLSAICGWRAELMSPFTFLRKPLLWLQAFARVPDHECFSYSPNLCVAAAACAQISRARTLGRGRRGARRSRSPTTALTSPRAHHARLPTGSHEHRTATDSRRACGSPHSGYQLCVKKVKPDERDRLKLANFCAAVNGAEPIRASTLRGFVAFFGPAGFPADGFVPCYGLAENCLYAAGGSIAGDCETGILAIDRRRIGIGEKPSLAAANGLE
eukprot:7376185-Prymnesium_polylepis.1